jgi:hypothetical protein
MAVCTAGSSEAGALLTGFCPSVDRENTVRGLERLPALKSIAGHSFFSLMASYMDSNFFL